MTEGARTRDRVLVFEGIATSLDDALAIETGGGGRIELVSGLSQGGLTPADGLIQAVLAGVGLPVAVILRPNRPSFFYTPNERREMILDIRRFEELGVRHAVTGMLDGDGIADIDTLEQLFAGSSLTLTFHRAIDESADVEASLRRINRCERITHLLTSLGPGSVAGNLDRLAWYAKHTRPRLILGGGVTLESFDLIASMADRYGTDLHLGRVLRHGSALDPVDPSLVASLTKRLPSAMD